MDSLVDFSPADTSMFSNLYCLPLSRLPHRCQLSLVLIRDSFANWCNIAGFININAIRLKKYGMQKAEEGQSLSKA
jgi:hypothetical protein